MASGEGLEPSSSDSKSNVLPSCTIPKSSGSRTTRGLLKMVSGHWDSNPEPCADLALTPLIRRLLCLLSYAPITNEKLVAVAGIEPASLDYQSSTLSLSYTALVDPAGLKPAPHGLKGRCSVTRAPDQKIGCGGRIRTFGSRINNAVPYQLGDATKTLRRVAPVELSLAFQCQESSGPRTVSSRVATSGCGGESRTRINSFTRRVLWIQLSYTAIW